MDDIMFIGNFTQKTYLEKMLGGTIMSELNLSAKVYYEKAEEMLEKKDSLGFMENIGICKVLSDKDSIQLAKVTFLKIKGLLAFSEYKKVLESISEALEVNKGLDFFRLKQFQGIALGFLGYFKDSLKIFDEIQNSIVDQDLLIEVYSNKVWINLLLYRNNKDSNILENIKRYLDLLNERFENISAKVKGRININYSVYYYYKEEYEKAIKILLDSFELFTENELPPIYNNLAEIYLKSDQFSVSDKVYEYTDKAEIIANRYSDYLSLGKSFYTKALAELKDDQIFTALDTLYLALEYFKKANATPFAFDCLVKINELVNNYKIDRLKSLKKTLKENFRDTPFYQKL